MTIGGDVLRKERPVRWGMVIDLRKCIGCGACSLVCSQTNTVPSNLWRRVIDCGLSGPTERMRVCVPMSCMHCHKPPCRDVCPTSATVCLPDGIVAIDSNRCIGCGYCIEACPYEARTIIFDLGIEIEAEGRLQENGAALSKASRIGVCSKCDFCLPRVRAGSERGLKPGKDADASPVCVISCMAGALVFGDLEDRESEVSRLIGQNRTACLQEDLGTEPSIYYIME